MGQTSGNTGGETQGLFRLYPSDYSPEQSTVDIVAIHGLGGNPFKTWTDPTGHLWLRDSLPGHIPDSRVLTFGYDSKYWFNDSQMVVNDFAIDLLNRLHHQRRHPQEQRRPIIFICHSLGGIVMKRLIVQGWLDKAMYPRLAESIFGVVFMGTPHRGSRAASPASIMSKIINAATLGNAVRTEFLKLLQVSSHELTTISQLSTPILKELSIVSFYERKPLGSTMIVEPFSAILGLPNERAIPLNADHKEISRPSPQEEHKYAPVWNAIKEMVESSQLSSFADNVDLLDQLFCVDYNAAQLRHRQPHPGTVSWIFRDTTFLSWLKSERSSVCVLSGPPGTGKSVLSRHLADTVISGSNEQNTTIGSPGITFFCSDFNEATNSEESVLRSLLHQVIQINPYSGTIVRNSLTRPGYPQVLDLQAKSLWKVLKDTLSMDMMKHAFIAIDAIEELGANASAKILLGLGQLVAQTNHERPDHRLRIFISSRFQAEPDEEFPFIFSVRVSGFAMYRNVEVYLHNVVEDFAARNTQFNHATTVVTRRKIVNHIAKGANGMFLWAYTAWEDFRKGLLWSRDLVQQKLEQLDESPCGINPLYDAIMGRIDPAIKDEALDIFFFLSVAARPMSEVELGILLGIDRSRTTITNSSDFEAITQFGSLLEREFGDLITVHDDNIVTFSHFSFKEYLQDTVEEETPTRLFQARKGITRACLEYLKLKDLLDDASRGLSEKRLDLKYPFLPYARRFFLHHLLTLSYDDPLWVFFAEITGPKSIYTLDALIPEGMWIPTPLRAVLDEVPHPEKEMLVQKLAGHGYDVNERWLPREYRGFALQYCLARAKNEPEMAKMAHLLLKFGADPSLPEEPIRSNFRSAIEGNSWSVYDALIRHPWIDLNARDFYGQTVVHNLVQYGPLARLSDVLDNHRVDVNIQDANGFTPLHLATSLNLIEKVRRLLKAPEIRLDLADKSSRTAFTLATYWGFQKIALALIETSQAFPISDTEQLSGIVFAAKQGHKELCFKTLDLVRYERLRLHIDYSGKGILHHTAMNNWDDMLEQCLTRGGRDLNVDQLDHAGKTALHYAAALGNTRSCSVLLHHGANTRLRDRNGRNAPQAAADAGFTDTLLEILKLGNVDPNQYDIEGRNLVHWAATIDCVAVMKLITEMPGANISKKDSHGKTPVDIAFQCQCANVGRFLDEQMRERAESGSYFSIYSWDSMYSSPIITDFDEDDDISGVARRELAELQVLQAKSRTLALREWENIRKQYPVKLWGLTIRDHEEPPLSGEETTNAPESPNGRRETDRQKTKKKSQVGAEAEPEKPKGKSKSKPKRR